MKLNVLGTEYEFVYTTHTEDSRLYDKSGYIDAYEKKIAIESQLNGNAPGSISNLDSFIKNTKRHEVIHAFLYESGLSEHAGDEQLVDWIAWQFPKLLEAFKSVDAL